MNLGKWFFGTYHLVLLHYFVCFLIEGFFVKDRDTRRNARFSISFGTGCDIDQAH